jgi:hypothetical protein
VQHICFGSSKSQTVSFYRIQTSISDTAEMEEAVEEEGEAVVVVVVVVVGQASTKV